jgi:hypothetical protein
MPEQNVKDLYPIVFGTPEGQKVLQDIHKYTRYKQSVFSLDNERQNCFAQGQQDVSNFIEQVKSKAIKRSLKDV